MCSLYRFTFCCNQSINQSINQSVSQLKTRASRSLISAHRSAQNNKKGVRYLSVCSYFLLFELWLTEATKTESQRRCSSVLFRSVKSALMFHLIQCLVVAPVAFLNTIPDLAWREKKLEQVQTLTFTSMMDSDKSFLLLSHSFFTLKNMIILKLVSF